MNSVYLRFKHERPATVRLRGSGATSATSHPAKVACHLAFQTFSGPCTVWGGTVSHVRVQLTRHTPHPTHHPVTAAACVLAAGAGLMTK